MMKKSIFSFCLALGVFFCATSANAMYFADFTYQKIREGDVSAVRKYLAEGHSIDSVNSDGMTALCQAVNEDDYLTYRKLRRMGANEKHRCMQSVDEQRAAEFAERYSPLDVPYVSAEAGGRKIIASESGGITGKQYAAIGAVAAAAVGMGIVIADDDDDDDKKSFSGSKNCGEGERWDGSQCVPISCNEGEVWDGSECVSETTCPTGERWNGSACVPIVCPENTHLVGNLCVADGNVVIEDSGDNPIYGVNSKDEDVFNLYSSPKAPDNSASISLKKDGAGNAYGVYGISNVFNSYIVGKSDAGVVNPQGVGTGNISIQANGSGAAYGLYAKISDITQYKEAINVSGWNEGTAYGNIDITHQGGGASYGVFGDVRAYNAYAAYGGKSFGNITIHGDGDIYGVSGYVAATNAVSPFLGNKVVGNINLYQQGNGDVYGMMVNRDDIPGAGAGDNNTRSWFAFNAYSSGGGDDVEGNIDIRNYGNGNAYGMYGGKELYNAMTWGGINEETGQPNGVARGNINILNVGSGEAFGMYLPDADREGIIANVSENGSQSAIRIVNAGNGNATGLRGGRETTIINSGEIDINNLGNGTAIGIYGEANSHIDNSGTINIHRDMYTDSEIGTTYNPTGAVGGTAYGIYAESGASVLNSGNITITGAAAGEGIYLADGATLENTGTVTFNGALQNAGIPSLVADAETSVDFDKFGGEVLLGKGGQFFADEFSGKLGVSKKTVLGSFDDEYVLDGALQAEKVEGVNVASKSAMFDSSIKADEDGGHSVVLSRKNFEAVLTDKSLAQFYEDNYEKNNNLALFDALKSAETEKALKQQAANLSGTDVLPNFRKENALVYRHLSRQFNDNLFNKPDENYIGGYKFIDVSMDEDGTLSGSDGTVNAAYGMLKGKADNGMTYGLGASVAHLKSDYDSGASRKSNIFGLWAPVGYDFKNGTQWFSKLYAGYADGSYDRLTKLGKYSADTTEYQYGISNELRHKMNFGRGFSFEPLAELNLLGIYQDGFNEGQADGALRTDSGNSLSLEAGLGAYLTKEMIFNEDNKLGIQIGGVYYVEFLDPDDGVDAAMAGMHGKYKLKNKSQDDYAVFSVRANYTYKDLMLYAVLEQETGRNKAFTVDTGIQYRF